VADRATMPDDGMTLADFVAWGTAQDICPAVLAERWLIVSFAERWLARHRLPLIACDRTDIDAWLASREGRILGDEGLKAIRTFLRYLEARGYLPTKPALAPEEDDAQVLDMQTHRSQRVS
jgi:hypothetical protein